MNTPKTVRIALATTFVLLCTLQLSATETTYRLFTGVALYIDNPDGKSFDITLDIRDMNVFATGAREVLIKLYGPDGHPLAREIMPDDGITEPLFGERIGGWDHLLQYNAGLRGAGYVPPIRQSALGHPKRLATVEKRRFQYSVKGGIKGIYRLVLAGAVDHYATVNISPDLRYGVAGHHTWRYSIGNELNESFVYVPHGTTGLHFAIAESDDPGQRRYTLQAPDGKILFQGMATGGFAKIGGKEWPNIEGGFEAAGYWGKVLKFSASPGNNDFQVSILLKQPYQGAFKDYVGMGSNALFCPTAETALALKGGTTMVDDLLFWHPFQIRLHNWLKANPAAEDDESKALRKEVEALVDEYRLIGIGDCRGARGWNNLAYSFGYAGCTIWRTSWRLLQHPKMPEGLKPIIHEGLRLAGDRYGFAHGIERTNGNSFNQIAISLWYAAQATGDPLLQQRFETFWKRWTNEGWGKGVGLSPSGAHQEIFAHAWHYMSYLQNNWRVGGFPMYVEKQQGITGDVKDDDRFAKVLERNRELFTYLWCREAKKEGLGSMVMASPWSSRTHTYPVNLEENWESFGHDWKGEPGPDFTHNVNGGSEWFAARRPNYYMLSYHGRLTPAWVRNTMAGQLGFSGGVLCQLTVPGKGPVLTSHLSGWYGVEMHPSNWRNFHIHSLVGETWDGRPLIAAISEHADASLEGNIVRSSGHVRDTNVQVQREYHYNPDHIVCKVSLSPSDYEELLAMWSQKRKWSEVRLAYEMIPFGAHNPRRELAKCQVTTVDDAGQNAAELTAELATTKTIRIDRGGYGVRIELPHVMPVKRGANDTVMIQLTNKEVAASDIALEYKLVPYRD